ncbi:UNVERIFIED_CONTAM: hypothetical protein Scaly_1880300 [Sesamum calycinum]|uniref:Uncharacterized protein n=1 Tax=Sesamum calycinum TaxID=2727403 RepID=A0AAW2NGV7_9LAMI
MASSSLGFAEEKGSEHEASDVVSPEKLEGDLHQDQIDVGSETVLSDETKRDVKRKSSSSEGRAIRKRNVAAVSRVTSPRTVTYVRRPRALRHPSISSIERYIPIIELVYVVPFMRHPEITAVLLEVVCDVVKKIVQNDFHTVLADLDDMMVLAPVAQMGQIDISWLEKRLEELYEIRNLIVKAAAKDFDAKNKMMMMAKKRFKAVQRSLLDGEF